MTWVDWVILAVLAGATLAGLAQGFFRTACSLAGLILGLTLAAWNYLRVGNLFKPIFRVDAVANTVAFLLIALLVMGLANVIGGMIGKLADKLGLGCLDGLAGAILGFIQGVFLVMVSILVIVAFYPGQEWLNQAKMPRLFFGSLHMSERVTPGELGERVRKGLLLLEHESPSWMHSGGSS
ncbi:MAG TPA: CvpA family protein [Terracidiphilus sp.]|jgi:membrane protein required for colicin V production